MGHVIVLDADVAARSRVAEHFVANALRVTQVDSFQDLGAVLAREPADAILVSIRIDDDFGALRHLTRSTSVPVLVLSDSFLTEEDKVRGLEAGAADYLSKSIGLRELLARANAAIRRHKAVSADRNRRSYSFADCRLTVRERRFSRPGSADVILTVAEFNLMVAFLRAPRRILSRERLLDASRMHAEEIYDRSLDALVLRLRRKIEADSAAPELIKTARGAGYFFDSDVSFEDRTPR